MGVRFDKWLAKPSTLHFLRQIIGLDHSLQPKNPRDFAILHHGSQRCRYGTAALELDHGFDVREKRQEGRWTPRTTATTAQARLRRVANDLSLRMGRQSPNSDWGASYVNGEDAQNLDGYFDILRHETNVGDKSLIGHLQIDRPENAGNFAAWKCVLETRQRLDGWPGIADFWRGLRLRSIDLPVTGELAHDLWRILLHACVAFGARRPQLRVLHALHAHAKDIKDKTGKSLPDLHKLIVGHFLQGAPGPTKEPRQAIHWHNRLSKDGLAGPHAVRDLATCAVLGEDRRLAMKKFKEIYKASEERDLYDYYMPLVLQHEEESRIASWHRFFISMNDLPSKELADHPTIRLLNHWMDDSWANSKQSPPTLKLSEKIKLNPPVPFTRASMSSLVGEVHGIKPKTMSDSFCARMFATQAFSVDFVVRGLSFLGVDTIGPLSLREMALRSRNSENFLSSLKELRAAGLHIQDCVYSQLLEGVCTDSRDELFDALLRSDQHPENYNDQQVQASLLSEFMEAEDWPQVHLTLMSMSLSKGWVSAGAWNRLLQRTAKVRNYAEVVRVFGHIHAERLPLDAMTLDDLRYNILPRRQTSKRPMKGGVGIPADFDSTDFVIYTHMYAADQSLTIASKIWIELLKRCGMAHRMDRVERLSLWITRHASQPLYPATGSSQSEPSSSTTADGSLLSKVFNDIMIQAIVTWGWRSASVRDQLFAGEEPPKAQRNQVDLYVQSCQPWARGLALLRQLRHLGISVPTPVIKAAVTQRLWMLFGPGKSTRALNAEAIRRNRLSLSEYVNHANEIWGEELFDAAFEPGISSDISARKQALMRKLFGGIYMTDRKRGLHQRPDQIVEPVASNGTSFLSL